jgi:hypothetical protein
MAIEITKLGKLPEVKRYTGKCRICSTEVKFLETDVTSRNRNNIVGVECPLCKQADIVGYEETAASMMAKLGNATFNSLPSSAPESKGYPAISHSSSSA